MEFEYYKSLQPFWGKWVIAEECPLGSGSYGKVYKIKQTDFEEITAALKIITIPQSESEWNQALSNGMDRGSVTQYFKGVVDEIKQEVKLMGKLRGHENIVAYEDHDIIEHADGHGWDILIRMELLKSIQEKTMDDHFMSRSEVLRLGIEICKALEYCEARSIIHRDIKPENLFVSETGTYKLGDFGVARTIDQMDGAKSKKGADLYMAPEVYKGEKYGITVDIYSLGIVLYKLMNKNRAPFWPEYPQAIMISDLDKALARRMKGDEMYLPSEAQDEFGKIIIKACAYRPEDRYRNAGELREALERIEKSASKAAEEPERVENASPLINISPIIRPVGQPESVLTELEEEDTGGNDEKRDTSDNITEKEREQTKTYGVFDTKVENLWGGDKGGNDPKPATENPPGGGNSHDAGNAHSTEDLPGRGEISDRGNKKNNPDSSGGKILVAIWALVAVFVLVALGLVLFVVISTRSAKSGEDTGETEQMQAQGIAQEKEDQFINFGWYEQDGNTQNGPEQIKWRVIDTNGEYELLLSEYVLDCIPYHNEDVDVTWEYSSLRKWLNNDFLNTAFNENERELIGRTTIENPDSAEFYETQGGTGAPGGNNTLDQVFLLSIPEVSEDAFAHKQPQALAEERIAYPTAYAVSKGCYVYSAEAYNEFGKDNGYPAASVGGTGWWLRSPGNVAVSASSVLPSGNVDSLDSVGKNGGVRPALWRKKQ